MVSAHISWSPAEHLVDNLFLLLFFLFLFLFFLFLLWHFAAAVYLFLDYNRDDTCCICHWSTCVSTGTMAVCSNSLHKLVCFSHHCQCSGIWGRGEWGGLEGVYFPSETSIIFFELAIRPSCGVIMSLQRMTLQPGFTTWSNEQVDRVCSRSGHRGHLAWTATNTEVVRAACQMIFAKLMAHQWHRHSFVEALSQLNLSQQECLQLLLALPSYRQNHQSLPGHRQRPL